MHFLLCLSSVFRLFFSFVFRALMRIKSVRDSIRILNGNVKPFSITSSTHIHILVWSKKTTVESTMRLMPFHRQYTVARISTSIIQPDYEMMFKLFEYML